MEAYADDRDNIYLPYPPKLIKCIKI